ncbi:EAL domain-containing protein [Rhodoplanes sp. TEM]|uniref:EAL domain-containing protein n=1 Tax=Rhodoplanes tepidamans TaxID=200616 RepID=A0ABT5J671_RHOTP|nr:MULTISPECIES: EAL domain-containing protein [Rhodoplanes]MDC7785146.1 EAL domain-containing protein [Rhodoplanes tepidamans]MDC7982620.1 EAL domain-containing protein [Rhodoplanes sp. TEM]MDQ0356637.1 diguanylate cyclase (GGDEF)-like protein [Rhodoplanes tepidamans]
MTLPILQLPKLIAERRSSAIFGLVIIAMLWTGIAWKYYEGVRADEREAERTNQNFAMVFEENVLRSIGEIDKALLYMRSSIETRKDSTDYHTIVATTDVLSEIIVQVAIIDANGIMRASNAGPQPAPPTDLSDREHYRVHIDNPDDALFISKPLVGRISGKWSVQFTRRFVNTDGSFAGVVVASLDPDHLTQFYDKIDLGRSASISLIGSDGMVRSSGGSSGAFALGTDLRGGPIHKAIVAGVNATLDVENPDTGETRLVTIRKVRGHPLWVSVGVDKAEIYQNAMSTLQLHVVVGLLLTILILAAVNRILRSEARAVQKSEQLRLTLEHMSQGIMLVTRDHEIPVINRRCAELLDLPPELAEHPPRLDELAERTTRHGKLRDIVVPPRAAVDHSSSGGTRRVTVSERILPDGTVLEVRTAYLPDGSFIHTLTDITQRWQAEARVARLAAEDPLTGLPNRRVFHSALDQVGRGVSAEGAPVPDFAVLFLDLDRFKVINDTLGHRIGDRLLQESARRLRGAVRDTDVLARLGGDEFAVVVSPVESRDALEAMADRLVETIAQPCDIDGHHICPSVSIGIAVGPQDGRDADDLLMAADLALYAVKAECRGTHKFFHASMNKEVNDRRHVEMDLREAIARDRLELHYQPIVDLRSGAVTGFEALTRWRHPDNGMVPPNVFIPVAEDSGLILPLGEWALAEACRQAVRWPQELKVAVNLSPVQLSAPNLVDMIERTLAATGLPAGRLELEITERVFLDDSEKTLRILRRLKQAGIRIAMDDFGTGYSSLSYLRSFPFDKIKIDRTFVMDLDDESDHVAIVQAVVHMARALGMTTTAEGVETPRQQEVLARLGCDEAQGYLFSRALPIDEVATLIANWPKQRIVAA